MLGKQFKRQFRSSAGKRRFVQFIESLQDRRLFSASGIVVEPNLTASPLVTSSVPFGYTPAQIKAAYGFASSPTAGAGETIAIIDAYNDPNIPADLAVFDKQFGLAAPPSLKVASETGSTSRLPAANSSWDVEISLDVEWAHAIAPDANILLVEANSSSLGDLLSAVSYAKTVAGVATISMSWGGGEFRGESAYDSVFTTPAGHQGITFVAASGDEGSRYGPEWPATSPNVLSVGGTTLNLTGSGAYSSETTWNDSTGGISTLESEPSYQRDAQSTGRRTTPDVSLDANPATGVAVYDSVPNGGTSGWYEVGGTSAGAPQWAALIAIADSARGASLDGATQTIPALYSIYANSSTYAQDFNDITSGSSGLYSAAKGYDLVTGLGTPKASALISTLSHVSTTTPAPAAIASAATRATASAAVIASATGSFAGVNYHGFEAPVDGIHWAIPSSSIEEPVVSAEAQNDSSAPDAFVAFAAHSSDVTAPSCISATTAALDPLNVSPMDPWDTFVSETLPGQSQQATDIYPMTLSVPADVISPPTDTAAASDTEPHPQTATISTATGRLDNVARHAFSTTAVPPAPRAVHLGEVLTAIASGIAVTALLIKQREPQNDRIVAGFIYNLGR